MCIVNMVLTRCASKAQYDPNHFDFVLSDDSSEWHSPKANRTHSLSSTMA